MGFFARNSRTFGALKTAKNGLGFKSWGSRVGALERDLKSEPGFRQGVPPHATYLFKHALVQDAAYGTLLREPRRALHAGTIRVRRH